MAQRFKAAGGDVWIDQSTAANAQATPFRFANKWTLDGQTDQLEVTSFGDTTKTYLSGLPNAQGQITGFQDNTATTGSTAVFAFSQSGTPRKLYLYPTTPSASGPYYYGTANLSVSYEADVSGAAALTMTWSAATGFTAVG